MKDNETASRLLTDEFQHEQHAMHRKIEEWRQWWQELSEFGQPRFGEMHDRLKTICNHLKAHFEHEEQSRFFQKVAELEPGCQQRCERVLAEHQKFLDELDCMCAKLGAAEPEFDSWGEANHCVENFLSDLEAHEKEEHSLFELWKSVKRN